MDIAEIPFNKFVGIKRSEKRGGLLMMEDDARYKNHLGTVHAGALLLLAESASGDYLVKTFGHEKVPVIPVVRKVEAKFRKEARGEIYARASMEESLHTSFIHELKSKGRVKTTVGVSLFNEQDECVHKASIEWFIKLVE